MQPVPKIIAMLIRLAASGAAKLSENVLLQDLTPMLLQVSSALGKRAVPGKSGRPRKALEPESAKLF